MNVRNIKKQLKKYIRSLVDVFDMFSDISIKDICIHEDKYLKRGHFNIKGMPFRYEMEVSKGKIERVQVHVALDEYYKMHAGDSSEEVKEIKIYLREIDTILVGRVVDKSDEDSI